MNSDSWAAVIDKHWPWLILVVVLVACVFYGAKAIVTLKGAIYTPVREWLHHFGRREQNRIDAERDRIDAELEDLRRQVSYQGQQLAELRYRDEMTWSWVLSDQEWHRAFEFKAAQEGWKYPQHVSYMEYRESWMKLHPQPVDYKDLV